MSDALTPLQRAFLALQKAEARVAELESEANGPIAVIGLGCRAPGGVKDADSFWRLLSEGGDAIGPPPKARWDHAAIFDPDPDAPGRIAASAGGFIEGADLFDAGFFGLSPREAEGMDPQQRLLLEVCWETLENAGQAPDRLEGSPTGVYVGAAGSDYAYMQMKGDAAGLGPHFASGIAHSVLSGRISYLLGLQGPSITVDTACSSSLVAVHLACQSLRAGECRLALAGGVNLILSPEIYVALSRARMLSPDGRCKTFDAAADGFGRGEGCAVLALKRLGDAEADGDRVLAVIRGSAVNQDGASSSLTAPNGPAQEAVIRAALRQARLEPRAVGYVEAHGTGTQLGDPLEANALGAVFAADRPAGEPLLIGSVKANIGHLESAAGAISLVKTILSLQHQTIPAHPHFKTPSPHIAWDELALRVPAKATPWPQIDGRRIGGVSSFGFSGTNVHILLEAAPAAAPVAPNADGAWLAPLSAQSPEALRDLAAATRETVTPQMRLADIARTLTLGRAHLDHRAVVQADSIEGLREGLDALARGAEDPRLATGEVVGRDPPRIAFLFTGQGAQYPGMAAGLYGAAPAFREAFDRCDEILTPLLGASLRQSVLESRDAKALEQTALAQPALFAVEYALAELLRSLGVTPIAVMGHSVGEYVAACVAGAVDLADALRLIVARGALMQSLPPGGGMAAVFAPEARVLAAIAPHGAEVSIAAVNGPAQTVISGAEGALQSICEALAAEGVKSQRLAVSHAFHSPLVEPILASFEREAAAVAFTAPKMRIISNVTGKALAAQELASPAYWRRHLRETVRFAEGLASLRDLDIDICIEVGPHPALSAFAAAVVADDDGGPQIISTLRRNGDDWRGVLDMAGRLHLAGVELDWQGLDPERRGRPIGLPTARFQRQRYWITPQPAAQTRPPGAIPAHPLLGGRLRSPLSEVVQFEAHLSADAAPFIADHVVQERTIMPAAAMIDMALSAGRAAGAPVDIENFIIAQPLVFAAGEARVVQTIVRRSADQPMSFEIVSADAADPEAAWTNHAQGDFGPAAAASAGARPDPGRFGQPVSHQDHYAGLDRRGLAFGESLRGVQAIRRGDLEALGDIAQPAARHGLGAFAIHPALLDACIQVVAAALPSGDQATFLPVGIEKIALARAPGPGVQAHVQIRERGAGLIRADLVIYDEAGEAGRLEGVSLRPLRAASDLYEIVWSSGGQASAAAAWSPSPAQLQAELGGRLPELAQAHGLDAYHEAFLELERLSAHWIARAFDAMGWRPVKGEAASAEALAQRLGIAPRFHRLTGRFLDILAEDGLLRRTGDGYTVAAWPAAMVAPCASDFAEPHPRLAIAAACGEDLAEILSGRLDPLHRLFPGGSSAMAERLYRESPEAKAYNQLLGEAVAKVAAEAPANRKVRILEVGGGTGGSTTSIAPQLPPDRVEYLFTDVGQSLVERARDAFGQYGFMSFAPFDLERDPAGQGVAAEGFDIIVAANVVHATADLKRTLQRLRGLLAPGGMLFLLEVTGFERWIDVTFGLTEGWWLFSDTDLRPDYPLIDRKRWVEVLASCGFAAAEIGAKLPTSREALLVARRPAEARRLALVGAADAAGEIFAERLRAVGHEVVAFQPSSWAMDGGFDDVVHLGFLGIAAAPADGEAALADQQAAFSPLLAAISTIAGSEADEGRAPRLWIVTRGGAAVRPGDLPDPAQATAAGLRRAAALEHPEWRPTLIDLDPDVGLEAQAGALAAALATAGPEQEIAARGGENFVSRLERLDAREPGPARLTASASGVLDDLRLEPFTRTAPGAGQVEIEVFAAGLNFRDVMNALAMREDSEPLGGECAGVVTAVGEGVEGFAMGDEVVATEAGCLATHVIADVRSLAHKPRGLTHAQAAALPLVTLTARHALEELAQLRAGQSVLIHAGAGGVGLAAIQIAQRIGAQVLATAGSQEKRERLRQMGVEHVFSSRTLDFEAEIAKVTGDRGVDVALNSLSGPFIPATVRCLAPEGIFLEIGKRDLWSHDQFRSVRPKARYEIIDLAVTRIDDPGRWGQMFRGLMADVAGEAVDPLPVRAFPLARAAEAFGFMAQARHVGKVVLTPREAGGGGFADLDPEGVYLITGGASGLGLETAGRLVERGARHLVLVGRRKPAAQAEQAMGRWRSAGVEVTFMEADASSSQALAEVFARIDATGLRLRGVIHSAGALADGALLQQDWRAFEVPLHAKVAGAWALHQLTRARRLDFFILYSSIAGAFGSRGQANHAAANAFMDALAQSRRAQGLPGLSIAWGAWSGVGAAAARGADAAAASQGVGSIAPAKGLEILEALACEAPAYVAVSPMDWSTFLDSRGPAGARLFSRFAPSGGRSKTPQRALAADAPTSGLRRALEEAAPGARREMLLDFVSATAVRVLGRQAGGDIDPRRPLNEMGLDSLLAVELRNRLGAGLGLARGLPATLVFDCPTTEALAEYLEQRIAPAAVEPEAASAAPASQTAVVSIDELSDDEVEAMFARMAST